MSKIKDFQLYYTDFKKWEDELKSCKADNTLLGNDKDENF
jgi:hypothetical protein